MIASKKGKMMGQENPFYGKRHTKAAKLKMSQFHTGKTLSTTKKEKLSKAFKSRFVSKKTRKKISINNRVLSKPVVQLDLLNKPLKVWESAKKASKECCIDKSSISRCAKNKQIRAGNFKWQYVDNIMQGVK